ncbi:MAG TPA: epoxyqueuosine reductase [Dehalococcoidia bacterium]|nr:epoxyqueuosine reductase [Dehalococcoidia bacterium]
METGTIMNQLEKNLKDQGFPVTTCHIKHLDDLKRDLETPLKRGLIGDDFFRERLSYLKLSPHDYREGLKTIIITAASQQPQETIFYHRGKKYRYLVPPTYSVKTDKLVEKIIIDTIAPHNYAILPAFIPSKIAAVRTGLAKYGRNNITYCNGMGSYFRLKAFLTDLPPGDDQWYEFELMPQCKNCNACLQSCPTGAITTERVLLQATRCLTYHNERIDDFPPWIDKSWHNSLIGCMQCQSVCPMNSKIDIHPDNTLEFMEEETQEFLNAKNEADLPVSVISKLEDLSLYEDWPLLVRNLKAML